MFFYRWFVFYGCWWIVWAFRFILFAYWAHFNPQQFPTWVFCNWIKVDLSSNYTYSSWPEYFHWWGSHLWGNYPTNLPLLSQSTPYLSVILINIPDILSIPAAHWCIHLPKPFELACFSDWSQFARNLILSFWTLICSCPFLLPFWLMSFGWVCWSLLIAID